MLIDYVNDIFVCKQTLQKKVGDKLHIKKKDDECGWKNALLLLLK